MNRSKKIGIAYVFAVASLPVLFVFQNCGQQGTLQVSETSLASKSEVITSEIDLVVDMPAPVVDDSQVGSMPVAEPPGQQSNQPIQQQPQQPQQPPAQAPAPGQQQDDTVKTQDCRHLEVADIKLNIEDVDSTGQCIGHGQKASAEFEIIDSQSFITLDKRSLKVKALKSAEVKTVFIKLSQNGNQILSLTNEVIELKTPSAEQSGLKFQLKNTVKVNAGMIYDLKFEIRAEDQFVSASSKCILKPVIKSALLVQSRL